MPRFKASNPVTGEEVYFDWSGSAPPTQQDIKRISDEQRTSRIAAKQKVADADSQRPFMEKLMSSGPAEYLSKALDVMGLDQPWHPIDSAKQVGAGVSQMVSGQGPEQHPRIAGAVKAVRGVMGIGGPPLAATGLAVAPIATLGAMTAGNLASRGVAAVEPDDWSPEVREAVSTSAGLTVGGLTGHTLSRMGKVSPPATSEPKTGELIPFRGSTPPPQEPRTGVNWSYAAPGQRGIEAAPKPGPSPQVMPPGTSIPPEVPTDEGQVVSPGDPRTTPQKPPIVTAPPQAGPRNIARPVPSVTPPIPKAQMAAPPMRSLGQSLTIQPPDTSMFESSLPEEDLQKLEAQPPQQDLSSQMRPEPTAPNQVSTVQPARPVTPPVKPLAPPLQSPQASPVQAPPPLGSSAQGSGAAPAVRPPAGPPPVTQQLQQPQVQAPQDLARAALARAQRPQPPMGPMTPPPAPPPAPISQRQVQPPQPPAPVLQAPTQPQVQPPIDLKAVLARGKQPPPVEPEVPELSPAESLRIAKTNQVLEMLKRRKDVTVDQIQRTAGTSGTDTKAILNNLQKRGLISAERGRYNYLAMSREELAPDPNTPEEPTAPPSESAALSLYRQQRISELQQQMGQAEDEEDPIVAETLRNHLAAEERNAKIEQNGTPEQKAQLQDLDNSYQRIRELEDKEEAGSLTEEEQQEMAGLYKKANSIEKLFSQFLKGDKGEQLPSESEEGLRRGPLGRALYSWRNLEKPGQARDISPFSAKLRSANQVLRDSGLPGAKEIGEQTPFVEDLKHKFVGTYERKAADLISHLNKGQRVQIGQILDKFADPERATGYDPSSIEAAIKVRDLLDEIYKMFPNKGTKENKHVGYIPNYLTHIKQTLGSSSEFSGFYEDLVDYHLGPFKSVANLFKRQPLEGETPPTTEANLAGQRGVGKPNSPFAERRTGALEDYELDVKNVLPVYIESAGKVIYDKPWIDKAQKYLNQIPEEATHARELATAYLRNYARYDAYPGLQHAWDAATGRLMRVVGRSVLGFDTRLYALHAARLFANIYPELPTKYMAFGASRVAENPIKAYNEVGRMGILPQNIRPWFFKRPMEKVDAITNALSIADFMPDGVAFHGFKKMYMDKGFSPGEASRMAANKTKEVSLRVTPARAAKLFSDDLSIFRPFTQFKQQVFKIAEQYATQPLDALKRGQYDRLARYIMGVGSMMYMYKKFHISTWHLDPFHLSTFHAAAYDRIGRILKKAADGDVEGALVDAGLLMIPGGSAVKSQIEKGQPSFIEQ